MSLGSHARLSALSGRDKTPACSAMEFGRVYSERVAEYPDAQWVVRHSDKRILLLLRSESCLPCRGSISLVDVGHNGASSTL